MLNDAGLQHIGYATDHNRIWYVAEANNLLMEIDIEKQTTKCLCMLPSLSGKSEEYRMLGYYENKLYILPFRSRVMYVYDLSGGENIHVSIGHDRDVYATGCIYRDGYMYIYGWNSCLIKYSICDQTYSYLGLNMQIPGMDYNSKYSSWTDALLQKDKIYIRVGVDNGTLVDNGILVIDENDRISYISLAITHSYWESVNIFIDDEKIHAIYIGNDTQIHSSIFDYEGTLLEDAVVLFHRDFELYPYVRAYLCGCKWVLLPYKSPWLCCVDESGGTVVDMECMGVKEDGGELSLCTAVIGLDDGWIYAVDQLSGDLLSINTNTLATRRIKLSLLQGHRNYLAESYHASSVISVSEMKGFVELKDFIDMLVEETPKC